MKHKRYDLLHWKRATGSVQQVFQLSDGVLVDFVAGEVHRPFVVQCCGQQITVLDTAHRWICFVPAGTQHAITVQLDALDRPLQFYVDVTDHNGTDEDGMPYGLDLYLDVVALPQGWQVLDTEVLDEDELDAALEQGRVTSDQATLAHQQVQQIQQALQQGTFQPLLTVQQHVLSHPRQLLAPG